MLISWYFKLKLNSYYDLLYKQNWIQYFVLIASAISYLFGNMVEHLLKKANFDNSTNLQMY